MNSLDKALDTFVQRCCSDIDLNVRILQGQDDINYITRHEMMTHFMTIIRTANAALSAIHKNTYLHSHH